MSIRLSGVHLSSTRVSHAISQESFRRAILTTGGETTRRILAAYEAGDLISMCAWCRRVEIDGDWLLAPRAALSAIDALYTLTHSICPQCAAGAGPPVPKPRIA
jgi:hypothetical protein